MIKHGLVGRMMKRTGLTRAVCEKAVEAFTSSVIDVLAEGDDVKLVGFGTFQVVDRAARAGRNPSTGEVLSLPAKKAPKFVPGAPMKDAIKWRFILQGGRK